MCITDKFRRTPWNPTGPWRVLLVVSARDGQTSDLQDLYARSYGRLVGLVCLVSGDQGAAEEVVQEAFVRLIQRWTFVQRYDDPEAWVRRVALRLLSNRRRKARNGLFAARRHGVDAPQAGPTGDRIDVARALRLLPVAQREVVVLHYLVSLSVQEVAAELSVPVGTVKSRLSRARAVLATSLREEVDHA